jgi:hypothetical protein
MAYEFAGSLYRNSSDYHAAIAEQWLSAGGTNGRNDMLATLSNCTDAEIASECGKAWEFDSEEFDIDQLEAEIRDIRDRFDEHFPVDAE